MDSSGLSEGIGRTENMKTDTFLVIFLGSALVISAIQDFRLQKIPNLVTYPTIGVALMYHSLVNNLDGLFFSAAGLALGMGVFMLPYLIGGMGAGDVKLMGAVGAILGCKGVFISTLLTVLVGGIYGLVVLMRDRKYSKGLIRRIVPTLKTFVLTRQFIPVREAERAQEPKLCYGIAIAIGTSLYVFLELSGYQWII